MKNQIIVNVGLDISINSTGICIFDTEFIYPVKKIRLTSIQPPKTQPKTIRKTKAKKQSTGVPGILYYTYDRLAISDDYGIQETNKVLDAFEQGLKIVEILLHFRTIIAATHNIPMDQVYFHCNVEGNVMGSFGGGKSRASDMATVSGVVRSVILSLAKTNNIKISMVSVAPTALKSSFSGDGSGGKDFMIATFRHMFPDFVFFDKDKLDDVIDAYALAVHQTPEEKKLINWKKILVEKAYPGRVYEDLPKVVKEKKPRKKKVPKMKQPI